MHEALIAAGKENKITSRSAYSDKFMIEPFEDGKHKSGTLSPGRRFIEQSLCNSQTRLISGRLDGARWRVSREL